MVYTHVCIEDGDCGLGCVVESKVLVVVEDCLLVDVRVCGVKCD